jgi:hypothetical protein
MDKISIDSKIYVSKLLEELDNLGLAGNLLDSDEIVNEENFRQILSEEVYIKACENEIECGLPILSEEQLDEIIHRCIMQDNLDSLEKDGLLGKTFSSNEMNNVYSLTEKAKKL